MARVNQQIEHEDLAAFLAAGATCTGQSGFYTSGEGQQVAVDFLHEYIQVNYRRLYARSLALGLNHYNRGLVLFNLLAAGAPSDAEQRREEGTLIAAALDALPPQRVYRLIRRLRGERVNNRRTRATIKGWVRRRGNTEFDALKYRAGLLGAARHAHLPLTGEVGRFLFGGADAQKRWDSSLLETYRKARYSQEALYQLPMTVAEGLAARRGVPRKVFLEKIQGRMTAAERLRTQASAAREGAKVELVDLRRTALTRLAVYLLSLSPREREARRAELEGALAASAARAARAGPALDRTGGTGKVAAVLDRSWSAGGSRERRRRPLAVALATSALLRASAPSYRAFWTLPTEDELLVTRRGQTDLAGPLLEALAWGAELVVVVSDGFENDPPGAAAEVLRIWRERVAPGDGGPVVVHLNPVFDPTRYMPRCLGDGVPALGIRDAEELPELLIQARFMAGPHDLTALEGHLARRAAALIARHRARWKTP